MKKSRKKLLRVVVDTNVIVSGFINKSGHPHQLISKLRENLFELVVTRELWLEYEEVLSRPKLIRMFKVSEEEIIAVLRRIQRGAILVKPSALPIEVRDPKDQKVLATALGGKADYLVTGDEDLLILKDTDKLGRLKIVGVKEFLKLFE